jgi:hypothetical protein
VTLAVGTKAEPPRYSIRFDSRPGNGALVGDGLGSSYSPQRSLVRALYLSRSTNRRAVNEQ